MYNLIKFEFYKLKNSKVFKNSLIVISCFVILGIIIFFGTEESIDIMHDYLGGRNLGFSINYFADKSHPTAVEFFYSALGFIPVMEILVLFLVAALVVNEYSNGTIKNIVSYGHKRIYIYISKLFIISLAIFILVSLLLFGSVLIQVVINGCGKTFSFNDIFYMFRCTLLLWIVLTSMASIYMCLATFVKSKSVVVGVGIILMFLSSVFLHLLYSQLNGYPNYTPTYMLINICSEAPNAATIYHMIINCIVLIVSTTLLGGFIFKNQDIK